MKIETRIATIVVLAVAVGCSQGGGTAASAPGAADAVGEASKAVVARYMDAELRGDTAGMSALLSGDYMGYGLGVADSADKAKTLEGVQHHWEVYKYGGKKYSRIQALAMTTAADGGRGRGRGDWVFEWGDIATDYPSTPEYGNRAITATFAYHAVFRVKDGKINARTQYFNHEDIMRQLGYKMLSIDQQQKPGAKGLTYK